MTLEIESTSSAATSKLGEAVGKALKGKEIIELVGDLGSGKTTFVRGLAKGIGSKDAVASPTFTISRIYRGKRCDLHHYDFYRLNDAGIVGAELAESLSDPKTAVAIEWSEVVKGALPDDRLQIEFLTAGPDERKLVFKAGKRHRRLLKGVK